MNHATLRRILVSSYFFLGGITGGLYLLGALEQCTAPPETTPALTRLSRWCSLPLTSLCAALLLLDLTKPSRFWRLLTQMKLTSAVSFGVWTLTAFGVVAFLSFPPILQWFPALRTPALLWIGIPAALALSSYTGVLLSASSRPAWSNSPWLGGLFLTLAFASAIAVALLVLPASGASSRLPRILAACSAATLGLIALHVRKLPRGPGTGAERLATGDLSTWFRFGILGAGLLPQLLWLEGELATVVVSLIAASSLFGGFLLRTTVFLCEER